MAEETPGPSDTAHGTEHRAEGPAEDSHQSTSGNSREEHGAADKSNASAPNTAEDNYGQLVQDAVIYGGLHYYGTASESASFGAETTRLIREAQRVDPQRIRTIRATFVAPEGHTTFAAEFVRCRIGVVTGRPNSGRATTAIHTLDASGTEVQEVTPEANDRAWRPERLPAEPDRAYLLDLTPLGDDPHSHHPKVREYARRVRNGGGRLIVVAESWHEDPADGYACLPVQQPDAEQVFFWHLAHLVSHGEAQRWFVDSDIRGLAHEQSLAGAARVAKQIQRTRESSNASLTEQRKIVLGVFKNYENDVRSWFKNQEKAHARAEERKYDFRLREEQREQAQRREDLRPSDYSRVLIEAVAVLEGCPSDAVLLQVDKLAHMWEVPVQLPSPISGGGLTAMLYEIGARVDADDRIRFRRPGLGDVVLDHLWREYPKARSSLLTWSNEAALYIPPDERRNVAHRWLHLADRQRNPGPISGLLVAWGEDPRLRTTVVPVVAQAAVHGELGPAVRGYLYQQAAQKHGGTSLDITVAQVCGQYGKVEPRTALVRLGWLADRAGPQVATEVHKALETIWEERSCRAAVLRALGDWEADEKERGRARFARRYLDEALRRVDNDGVPLLAAEMTRSPEEVPPGLVAGAMVATLTGGRPKHTEPLLDTWFAALDSALSEEIRQALEWVLLEAAASHTAANIRIGHRLEEWKRNAFTNILVPVAERVTALDPLTAPHTIPERERA